ncbi:MAG: DUF1294 domain-containing protein [Cellulosilyticaceae bacterium]
MIKYSIGYLVLVNLIGLWSMYSDKQRAIKKQYRISEKNLFLIALLGGSMGSVIGMNTFRHKTKHWYFKIGMPLILILQIVGFGMLYTQIIN